MYCRRRTSPGRWGTGAGRRGGVLVEFALVSFAFYLLFAATISLGRMVYMAQVAQDVARFMARELALTPLPAVMGFEEALDDPVVKKRIYDKDWLVVDIGMLEQSGMSLDEYFADAPVVNQALRPLMIYDYPELNGVGRRLYRFPGTIVTSDTSDSGLTVAIPHVDYENGAEVVHWMQVVEEVGSPYETQYRSAFNVVSAYGGLVALRINVPFQSATMSQWVRNPGSPFDPTVPSAPITEGNTVLMDMPGGAPTSTDNAGPYGGSYGLGRQYAMGMMVRPFRRVITAQAFFRREVFGDPRGPQPVDPTGIDPDDPLSPNPGDGAGPPYDPHDPTDPWSPPDGDGPGHPYDPHDPTDPWSPPPPGPPFDPIGGWPHNG